MDPIDNNIRDYSQASAQPLQPVPNSTGVLVLGILSIVFAGLIGLILGIIALNMARTGKATYDANPERYTKGSMSNLNGGRICAIIGVVISCLAFLFIILMIASS